MGDGTKNFLKSEKKTEGDWGSKGKVNDSWTEPIDRKKKENSEAIDEYQSMWAGQKKGKKKTKGGTESRWTRDTKVDEWKNRKRPFRVEVGHR